MNFFHFGDKNYLFVIYIFSGIDTRMKFSVQPLPGDDAFQQWNDAMKAVARLPMGIPPEFRKTVSVYFFVNRFNDFTKWSV